MRRRTVIILMIITSLISICLTLLVKTLVDKGKSNNNSQTTITTKKESTTIKETTTTMEITDPILLLPTDTINAYLSYLNGEQSGAYVSFPDNIPGINSTATDLVYNQNLFTNQKTKNFLVVIVANLDLYSIANADGSKSYYTNVLKFTENYTKVLGEVYNQSNQTLNSKGDIYISDEVKTPSKAKYHFTSGGITLTDDVYTIKLKVSKLNSNGEYDLDSKLKGSINFKKDGDLYHILSFTIN